VSAAARAAGHQLGSAGYTRAIRGVGPDMPTELLAHEAGPALAGRMRAALGTVTTTTDLHDAVTAVDSLLRDRCVGRSRENQRRLGLG